MTFQGSWLAYPCSTPFGIMEIALPVRKRNEARDFVLNAFRHHGIRTRVADRGILPTSVCSTPFGIIGIRTWGGVTCERVGFGAQRLSASLEFAQFDGY